MNEGSEIPSKFEQLNPHQQSRARGGAYEIGRAAYWAIRGVLKVPDWLKHAVYGISHPDERGAYEQGVNDAMQEDARLDMGQEKAHQAKENPGA